MCYCFSNNCASIAMSKSLLRLFWDIYFSEKLLVQGHTRNQWQWKLTPEIPGPASLLQTLRTLGVDKG